jgi:hypothetical protein
VAREMPDAIMEKNKKNKKFITTRIAKRFPKVLCKPRKICKITQ